MRASLSWFRPKNAAGFLRGPTQQRVQRTRRMMSLSTSYTDYCRLSMLDRVATEATNCTLHDACMRSLHQPNQSVLDCESRMIGSCYSRATPRAKRRSPYAYGSTLPTFKWLSKTLRCRWFPIRVDVRRDESNFFQPAIGRERLMAIQSPTTSADVGEDGCGCMLGAGLRTGSSHSVSPK